MNWSRRGVLGGLGTTGAVLGAGPANAADKSVQIPFRVTHNQPWVAVTINRKNPNAFLIDTGANFFGISESLAKEHGLTRLGKGQVQSAIGRSKINFYEAREVAMGGGAVRERNAILGATVRDDRDLIRGVIPVAKWAIMGLNFDSYQMTVATSLEEAGAPEGYETLETFSENESSDTTNRLGSLTLKPEHMADVDQRPVIQAQFDGDPVRLMVDTGASGMLFLFPDYVKRRNLWEHYPKHLDSGIVTGAGAVATRTVRGEKLKIGRYAFTTPIVVLGNPADSARDGSQPVDGVIGIELLRRLNFLHHPIRRRFYFQPSKAIMDVYRYDRAGMYADLDGGAIRVIWLKPNGAAARAGLAVSDKIVGWRGTDGFYGLMWALQGAPGSKVEIQVERNGAPVLVSVELDDPI